MKVEFINSQRMKISDQGIVLELIGDVSELQDIANSINAKGVFHLPKGQMQRRDDFICIDNGRVCVETDPHTLNQIMDLGPKFQMPMPRSAHIETPTANRGYMNNLEPLPPNLEPLVPFENREVQFVENSRIELPLVPPKLHP